MLTALEGIACSVLQRPPPSGELIGPIQVARPSAGADPATDREPRPVRQAEPRTATTASTRSLPAHEYGRSRMPREHALATGAMRDADTRNSRADQRAGASLRVSAPVAPRLATDCAAGLPGVVSGQSTALLLRGREASACSMLANTGFGSSWTGAARRTRGRSRAGRGPALAASPRIRQIRVRGRHLPTRRAVAPRDPLHESPAVVPARPSRREAPASPRADAEGRSSPSVAAPRVSLA